MLATEKLEAANFTVGFDRTGLSIRGEGRVGGERAQMEIRQNTKGQGEATLAFTLDNAARQKRGFGPELGVNGPVQVKVSKQLGKGAEIAPRVELDLTKTAIDGVIPGFAKPAGRAGRATFNYLVDADGPDLDDFTLDASPVLIRGKIELNKQSG
ncbi:hypothetical protein AB4156_42365, partial [Cupriavidus sp. 2MCAB6]|uniref:hypothetical protein n=1 Tax=Cupriavidus sp. 2MCAB6 TaxID=3232981 RepID=UPI003F90FAFB